LSSIKTSKLLYGEFGNGAGAFTDAAEGLCAHATPLVWPNNGSDAVIVPIPAVRKKSRRFMFILPLYFS
jgi:hypothetical protein